MVCRGQRDCIGRQRLIAPHITTLDVAGANLRTSSRAHFRPSLESDIAGNGCVCAHVCILQNSRRAPMRAHTFPCCRGTHVRAVSPCAEASMPSEVGFVASCDMIGSRGAHIQARARMCGPPTSKLFDLPLSRLLCDWLASHTPQEVSCRLRAGVPDVSHKLARPLRLHPSQLASISPYLPACPPSTSHAAQPTSIPSITHPCTCPPSPSPVHPMSCK